jgi:carboxyl-terminal processing protease
MKKLISLTVVRFILGLTFLTSALAQGANLECSFVPKIVDLFLKNHYLYHQMNDELKARTVEQFIKQMDPSKTLLLEEDLPKLREQLTLEFTTAEKGDCAPLLSAKETWQSRAAENETIVKEILGNNYQVDSNTELILDSKKRSFPKTLADKKKILRKMVDFQVSNLLISKIKMAEAKKQLIHRYELVTKRIKEQKLTQTIAHFADSFSSSLDPHSNFMGPDELEDFQIQMGLSLEGIGAVLRYQDGFTVIDSLVKGGSADRAKVLKSKDKIIAVSQETGNPVSTVDMDLRDVVKLIRGKKGTKVTLTVLRQGKETQTLQATLVRDKVNLVDQSAKISYNKQTINGKTYNIGIIDLPSFYGMGGKGSRSCSADVKELLVQANKNNVDGIILNLSRNGGGLLDEAVKISGLFIQKGGSVATKNTAAQVDILKDNEPSVVYRGPLAVVISRLSASASEILAGALKNYKRAVIIGGDHTFGKGSVQALSDLPSGLGGMKVTTAMFFTPGGQSTQLLGVSSDIVLPSVLNNDDIGEKILDYPLPPQSIPSFISPEANSSEESLHWSPLTEAQLTRLTKLSKDRVTKDATFAEIVKRIDKTKKQNGVVKIADIQKESLEKEQKKAHSKKKEDEPTEGDPEEKSEDSEQWDEKGPFVKEASLVVIDLIQLQSSKQN